MQIDQYDFWYPGVPVDPGEKENATHLVVGLCHVRATDDLRISYDFQRDGWKIEQMRVELDPDEGEWEEVFLAKSYALNKLS